MFRRAAINHGPERVDIAANRAVLHKKDGAPMQCLQFAFARLGSDLNFAAGGTLCWFACSLWPITCSYLSAATGKEQLIVFPRKA